MEVALGVLFLLIFILFGMPIAFALGTAGLIGLFAAQGPAMMLGLLKTTPFRSAANFNLTAVPLFVLMAELLNQAGYAKHAYFAAIKWIGHWRGGLGMATMVGGAIFGACSGSSSASTAVFGSIAIPEMRKYGYSQELSSGTVALAGTLAALIPPSILMVIYGVETETSIGKLLLAGLVPGILMTILYCINIWVITKIHPEEAPTIAPASWKDRFLAIKSLWPIAILGVVVMGVIYTGIATPTEAAAIGAAGTAILGLATRNLNWGKIKVSLNRTLKIVGMIFAIIIGATFFAYFLTTTGTSQAVISTIGALAMPRWVILLAIIGLYIILGMFLDAIGCMLLTIPLVFPLIVQLGYDPIWFGAILVMILEIGLITPPVGINCFIASSASGIPLNTVFRGSVRLLVASFIGLALMVIFPQIALFIPSVMK